MDISVIVPVYNVEKYIVRCLDSIFNQHFSGTFEVIAVDDASTDSSLQILRSYKKNEERLRIITHETNKKLSFARSSGMKASKGDYIMHIDADDWLLPSAFENLHSVCKKTNADVVVFGIIQEDHKGNSRPGIIIKEEFFTSNKNMIQEYFYGSAVNKIVKRRIVENMISGSIGVNSGEDLLYSFEVLLKANTIYLFPDNLYVYFLNNESITKTIQPKEYVQIQITVLIQIQSIVTRYEANPQLVENILDYFEKWLYLMIAQMQFGTTTKSYMNLEIISHFSNIPIISQERITRLEAVITSKYRCLIEVVRRFKIRTAVGIIYRGYRKKQKSN